MKKIIKLTESDLTRIVNRVINEREENYTEEGIDHIYDMYLEKIDSIMRRADDTNDPNVLDDLIADLNEVFDEIESNDALDDDNYRTLIERGDTVFDYIEDKFYGESRPFEED